MSFSFDNTIISKYKLSNTLANKLVKRYKRYLQRMYMYDDALTFDEFLNKTLEVTILENKRGVEPQTLVKYYHNYIIGYVDLFKEYEKKKDLCQD